MPTIDELGELRGALEKGLAAGVNAAISTVTRLNSVTLQKDTPRFEISVTIGAATTARRAFPAELITRFARWNFTVKFVVVTRPQSALVQNEGESDADFQARTNANNGLHALLVAHLRGYASSAAQASWTDAVNFPNHFMAEALKDAGSPSTLKPQEGNEQTTLSYSGVVAVRETAWQQLTH